jgi:S1-C subfamily serine protease
MWPSASAGNRRGSPKSTVGAALFTFSALARGRDASSGSGRFVGAGFDVDAEDGLAEVANHVKAGVAEFQTELIFAFRVERAVALVAGGKVRALALLAEMNFRMDF